MDIPLVLSYLTTTGRILVTDDWGPCANTNDLYPDFANSWRGSSPVPTLQEMDGAWSAIQVAAMPSLATLQAARIAALTADRLAIVSGQYATDTLLMLNATYSTALAQGLANRAAYCAQLLAWGAEVVLAYSDAAAAVQAATTADQVAAVQLDAAALIAADPLVALPAALAILD